MHLRRSRSSVNQLPVNQLPVKKIPASQGSGSAAVSEPETRRHLPGKLAGLTVWRQVLRLAIWPFLEQMLGFAVGFVDTAIAGRLSVAATEAIAVGAYLSWLLSLMFGAVGIGAGALVARAVGARHRRLVHAVVGQAFGATLALGCVLSGALWFAAPGLGAVMNLSDESLDFGIVYLRVFALGTPALGIMFVNASCFRSAGDTRTPFLILALVNLVNVTASLALVYGPAPWGGHGVRGIALGTTVAWAVGASVMLGLLLRRRSAVRLYCHRLRPQGTTLRRIGRISGPQFIDSLAMWCGNFLLAGLVGYLGATIQPGALAAHIIAIRIEALSFLPAVALAQAAATLMGQYLGLGDVRRARQAVGYCWGIAMTLMGTLGILFFTGSETWVSWITGEPRLLKLASPLLVICGPAQVFLGTAIVLEQAVRAAGDTRPVAILVALSTFLVRLPAAYLIGVWAGYGITGIWFAVCCENALRGTLIALYFLSGRWSRVSV